MNNPWLDVPLSDYEGHMSLPGVGQAQMLSDVFSSAIERFSPHSVAVLGCAGGNGLDRIPSSVSRVVGVDLNPHYIAAVEARYRNRFGHFELIVGDVQAHDVSFAPVDLVYAGLVLEYVDVEVVVAKMPSLLSPSGRLVTVLQLPGADLGKVSPSTFSSVQAVGHIMRLIPPGDLQKIAESNGFVQTESRTIASSGSKQFQVQVFVQKLYHEARTPRTRGKASTRRTRRTRRRNAKKMIDPKWMRTPHS